MIGHDLEETKDIDEQVRQLHEKKAAIIAKVSEVFWSNRPLEELTLQSTLYLASFFLFGHHMW
ncbi:unnamed protein product [Prunus armeniaca]